MLGNQPRLGAPLTSIFGQPIYAPWRLLEWWYAYEAYAPDVFRKAGMFAAGSGIAGTVVAIAGSLWRARQNKLVTTYGSARWADVEELKSARLFSGHGVFLGKLGETYLRHDGPEHVLAFAPTRSGKGVGLVIPTLLTWPHSTVIHDIKGENWQLTAGFRSKFSHCLLFNPADPKSARYNPLLEVRKGEWEVRDVQNIADILVDPEGALERRNHWEKTSHALLVGVILHVLYAEGEKTLARVASFLSDPSRSIERTLRVMMSTNHMGTDKDPIVHPVVASVARELLNKSENERSGVLSTAMSFLGLYRDPVVARNTSSCDWRIADLMEAKKPLSLYLVIPPADHRLAPWLAHVMVSRQETARALLTPGEVMQLPSDEALVLVSGLQPIKAKKLRYYEDDNFKGRILPPPVLSSDVYADRPPQTRHDWEGQIRAEDTRLEKPWFAQLHGEGNEAGGLTREPWNEEAAPKPADVGTPDDLNILDDDFGVATANTDPMARSAAQRSFGVNDAEGDDALPVF